MSSEKLKNVTQWPKWLQRVTTLAEDKGILEYIDPDLSESEIRQLGPEPSDFPEKPTLRRGDDEETHRKNERARREWRDDVDTFKYHKNEWDKKHKAIGELNQYITTNLEQTLQDLVLSQKGPYAKLVFLQKRFGKSTSKYTNILEQWMNVMTNPPREGTNILLWLDAWETKRQEAESEGIVLAKDSKDLRSLFIRLTREILPFWWQQWHSKVVIQGDSSDIQTILDDFRTTYEAFNTQTTPGTALKGAFATWQGNPEAGNQPPIDLKPSSFEERGCTCGMRHSVERCWFLNKKSNRPPNYKPNNSVKEAVEAAFKDDPKWKEWVFSRINRANQKASKTSSISDYIMILTSI
ncbi:hypothetical protein N7495_003461 [Penicillium taxi]|uniref:uncharacterized protein n=1 Tax=Penicillium taxi TaxID=168475 RepID=UPI0025457487|nr:uncharacterized protein N7495_003461 [Penicillium taxi]KAJ5902933.1 hypothetical protein N7495_003461 [Penicillium taxi]